MKYCCNVKRFYVTIKQEMLPLIISQTVLFGPKVMKETLKWKPGFEQDFLYLFWNWRKNFIQNIFLNWALAVQLTALTEMFIR